MSDNAGLGISVKDFAEQRGKTVQAVYQQMKRKENAVALEGHVFTHRVGNKDVKYLDDEAVSILDKSSQSAPLTILEDGLRAELDDTKQQLDMKEKQVIFQEGQLSILKEQLADAQQKLMALSEPQAQIDTLKAQNADLSAEVEVQRGKVAEIKKKASEDVQEAQKELSEAHERFEKELKLRDAAHEEELQAEKERHITFKEYWQRRKKAKSQKTDSSKE